MDQAVLFCLTVDCIFFPLFTSIFFILGFNQERRLVMEIKPIQILDAITETSDANSYVRGENNENGETYCLEIKEEKNVIENDNTSDIEIKEEVQTTNIITVRIKKKKGEPRRSEPYHLYTPELFQSLFGFSIYQCHGDSEWKQVLKKKVGTLHFKSNGTRIRDSNAKPLRVQQSRKFVNKKKAQKDGKPKLVHKKKAQKDRKRESVNKKKAQKEFFDVKVESIAINIKEENCNALAYVSCSTGNKRFHCNLCNLKFKERKTCKNHIEQVHFKIRRHKCDQCDKSFYVPRQLKKHVEAVHLKLKPFTCEKCKKSFANIQMLKIHMITHEKIGRFVCPTCGKKIRHKQTFKEHLDRHNNVKYTCTRCEKDFSCKKSLRNHILSHNPQYMTDNIKCSKCGKSCVNKHSLKKHERFVHSTNKYPCTICKKTFPDVSVLRKHMSNVHDNVDKLFKCEHCKASFKNKTYLHSHVSLLHTHTFMCAHCPATFSNKPRLAYHLRRYHASLSTYKPHRCNQCKMHFISKGHVNRHMKSHMKDQKVVDVNLSCGKCGKKYKLEIALQKHELICK